jgi:hypothetical protein
MTDLRNDVISAHSSHFHQEKTTSLLSAISGYEGGESDIIRQTKSRRMRWAGHVARMGEGRNVYRVLVGKPEGNRPLGRPRRRWEDGIEMDLREIGWGV